MSERADLKPKTIKIPGPDHPITIERNAHRFVVTVAGRVVADTRAALTLREASAMQQHNMFMPSRDRLVEDNAFAQEIEKKLEEALHDHQGLRDLKNARQKLDVEEQLADNKPLEVLQPVRSR
jgi:hypothetical protein